LEPAQVSVRVFNGGTKRGLARQVADILEGRKFNVIEVGNVEQDVTTTVILGANDHNPEVQLVLGQFREGASPMGDGRSDGTVDVLVGSDFAGLVPWAQAKQTIDVPGDQVCLPSPTETPTPTPTPSG